VPFLPRTWPLRAQILVLWLPLVLLSLWAISHLYIAPDSRACVALYRTARTAADTAQVDATIPATSQPRTPEARSCGSIRSSARWF